jgi:hypothetical protein
MGRLQTIGKIVIRVNAMDHLPPHFHVVAPDFEALIEVETPAILRGDLAAAARKSVMAWIEANRAVIAAEWNRINPRFPIA